MFINKTYTFYLKANVIKKALHIMQGFFFTFYNAIRRYSEHQFGVAILGYD